MSIAAPVHIVATIVLLGGLFLLYAVFRPSIGTVDSRTALSLWHTMLSRFFVWAWISMALMLASGIAMVNLKFGGFSGMPTLHRWNMVIGLPAIALYGYLYFVPWQRYRRALSRNDWMAAEQGITHARIIMVIILTLGLIASVVSAAGRYYGSSEWRPESASGDPVRQCGAIPAPQPSERSAAPHPLSRHAS